jgi:2-dehydro-3-deoxyphosphogluconate aldolase / (4S)-4-hydroxy-2-oxoglutarate aldolase
MEMTAAYSNSALAEGHVWTRAHGERSARGDLHLLHERAEDFEEIDASDRLERFPVVLLHREAGLGIDLGLDLVALQREHGHAYIRLLVTLRLMDVMDTIREDRLVAVVRASKVADPVGLARALEGAGIRCVEFTFTIDDVLEAISAAADAGVMAGAGTVLHPGQARDAVAAGARFVVSPVLARRVARAVPSDVPVVLAGFTPTELHEALEAGAAAAKLFPARVGGPSYVRDLLGPLPHLPIIPSGGVDEGNAADFLAAGAVAVYSGSGVAPPTAVEVGDNAGIAARARRLVAALGVARG